MKLSLIIPVFNEESCIPLLRERIGQVFHHKEWDYEVILINDGSTDQTTEKIKEWIMTDPHVILLELSRNFGHQAAITAGLKESQGDCVVIMDADLQDPPELIPEMLKKWQEGSQVVLAERSSRSEVGLKRFLFIFFYRAFDLLSDFPIKISSGVFSLIDRRVVHHLLSLREKNRFIPGLRSWVGFSTTNVHYERQPRAVGEPKQSLRRLLRYGFDAIFSFSYKPLRFSFFFGLIISASCFLYALVLITLRILGINVVPGFTTTAVAIFFLGGVILISNGIIGEYLGRVYDEVKNRPLFIISRKISRPSNNTRFSIEEYTTPQRNHES